MCTLTFFVLKLSIVLVSLGAVFLLQFFMPLAAIGLEGDFADLLVLHKNMTNGSIGNDTGENVDSMSSPKAKRQKAEG